MAAPSGTTWGNIVTGSKSTRQGRIGMYVGTTASNTSVSVSVQVWFWSRYTVSDSSNTYYYNVGTTNATSSQGSRSISHPNNSGSGWSTTNQTLLGSYSYSYTRGTSASTKYFAGKFTGIDTVGSGNVMSISRSVSIPALASYTISYNANGGDNAPSAQTKWYGTNLTLSSSKPTRTGYSFQGWATSSSGSVAYAAGASYTANAAATLYAVWKANTYTVSFNANGGSGAPANQTKTYGVNLTLSSTKPTRTNYNFKGWGTSASSTTVAYAAGATYTNNSAITLYAIWELAYVKPRITSVNVYRCNSSGTASDTGTYYQATFKWATDKAVSSIKIERKLSTDPDSSYTSTTVSASGTSGTVTTGVLGAGGVNVELTYDIRITVADSLGSTSVTMIIHPMIIPIDILNGGKGVAIGRPASIAEFADIGFKTRFRKNIVMNQGSGSNGSGAIYGEDPTTGADIMAFQPQNENGNTVIGYGNYARGSGHVNIYSGANIALYPGGNSTSAFYVNGANGRGYMNRQNDIGMTFKHATSGKSVGVGVGSGGENRGVHDTTDGSWIIHRNSANTTVVTTTSDARLKENLGEISEEEMHALLSGMQPINFIYKNDENRVVQNGFIAQNVRDVLIDNDIGYRSYLQITEGQEELYDLNASEEDVRYGLDYSKFTPLLVAGWQYHEKKIKELEEKIMALEKRLEVIENG